MISIEIIILSVVAVLNAMIVWLVASQGWRSLTNIYFALVAFFSTLWGVGVVLFLGAGSFDVARLGLLLFSTSPMLMLFMLCLFSTVFHATDSKRESWTLRNILYCIATVIGVVVLMYDQNILVAGISLEPASNNQFQVHQSMYMLYGVYFSIGFYIVISNFIRNYRRTTGYKHKQLTYISGAVGAVMVLSAVTNIVLPIAGMTNYIWLGPLWTVVAVIIITVSIVKHALFDIKLAAVRSSAYIGVLLTLSLIYYLLAFLLSTIVLGSQTTDAISVGPVNMFMALALAFAFQPVKKFFDKVSNDIFYRDNYDSDKFFAALSNLLTSTVDLRGLLERASQQIAMTFKVEHASFFVYFENGRGHHISAGTQGHARLPTHDAHMLDQFMLTNPRDVYATNMIADEAIRRMLRSHDVELVMPLRQSDKITGYVLLGDRLSGTYTKRDLNVLATVSNELVIAIQNALSIHEVKELNATLQQRIDIATKELRSSNAQLKHLDEVKDEFMSMASHQLRTPLTSVKGYISMVLEGDVGKVSAQQQKLLTEAFKSSERMVRLISDFLDVSRLQTGKFVIEKTQFDLVEVVKQEVRDLELIARSHELKLRLNIHAKGPMIIHADEQKIRQVIMNYIDNAIYYSSAKSTIIINLEHVKDDAALTVVDTGIGVPEDVQARLFTKFFRAPNARQRRPDGTGIGLYLTRRVLNAHDGSIIFSSKEGKGSTFGFRLPIVKDAPHKSTSESKTSVETNK